MRAIFDFHNPGVGITCPILQSPSPVFLNADLMMRRRVSSSITTKEMQPTDYPPYYDSIFNQNQGNVDINIFTPGSKVNLPFHLCSLQYIGGKEAETSQSNAMKKVATKNCCLVFVANYSQEIKST